VAVATLKKRPRRERSPNQPAGRREAISSQTSDAASSAVSAAASMTSRGSVHRSHGCRGTLPEETTRVGVGDGTISSRAGRTSATS
jgi:hypothetical protein